MHSILKWASWIVSAIGLLCIFIATFAYLIGNVHVLGAQYGTYLFFGEYFLYSAILLVLLTMSCKEKTKD
jgi:hypothetical protein